MAQKHINDNSSSSSSSQSDDESSSSPSKSTQETKRRSGKDPPPSKDSAPPPKSNDSNTHENAPSAPSPESQSPPSKDLAPAQAPPPTPTPSPPPPPPPIIQPSSPPPSPPPPSSQPPPPPSQNGNSSSLPSPPYLHRASPPPPQVQAPPPFEKSSSSSPPSSGGSSHSSSASDNSGKYVGYTLAGVFFVALVVVVILTFRRKKSRGDVYVEPHLPPANPKFQMKPGVDRLYYGQQLGVANGPQSPPGGSNFGSGKNLGGSMNLLGAPLDLAQPMSAQIAFSYDTIMEITDSFSSQNIIGEGGFGCVYKGLLPDGKGVAVKQLKAGSGQGDREFRAEVEIISRVHHRHLVSLVGYCIYEQQRVLIYEYVPNGTLHHHLHGSGMPVLDWDKRLKIAIGAAKGLAYLHEECGQKIIHRDIKSANILLDYAFEAQVADFGLARLTDTANTHVSTRVMGTFGYMAPDYATSGKLTDRSDVFSFGVVLLELVTGRKPVDETQPLGDESLVEWARPLLLHAIETRDFSELIDPRLENHFVESEMFRMIEAAAACVRHLAPKRPRMVQVVRALDSGDEISDLSNGVKYGHSTIYDSGQYDRDIMRFRRMANGSFVDSDFDMYSTEYGDSREISGSQHAWMRSSSSGESESRAINKHGSSTE